MVLLARLISGAAYVFGFAPQYPYKQERRQYPAAFGRSIQTVYSEIYHA
jgi:hypothetical protein